MDVQDRSNTEPEDASDQANYFGVKAGAKDTWDIYDHIEPAADRKLCCGNVPAYRLGEKTVIIYG